MILGSGLGPLAESVENASIIPFNQIPGWPVSTVVGHKGQLVLGQLEGQDVIVMQGRAHYYEGYSMAQIGLPVRVMQRLGVELLVVTNAAGAVNPDFEPGDLMLITDHINLLGMAKRLKAKNLQASTSEVYGGPMVYPQPEDYRGSVNCIGPRSCYDEGKRCAKALFINYHRQHGLKI